mgnify:CR=1 FL=1
MVAEARGLAAQLVAQAPRGVAGDEVGEAIDLLNWLADDHFTFLGCVEYELLPGAGDDALRRVVGSELGVVRRRPLAPTSA